MIRLDAATVLLQWATGGLLFLWVTSRRREVGLGYGWLLRGSFGTLAVLAGGAGRPREPGPWGRRSPERSRPVARRIVTGHRARRVRGAGRVRGPQERRCLRATRAPRAGQ